jgi:hypothetical protein
MLFISRSVSSFVRAGISSAWSEPWMRNTGGDAMARWISLAP